MVTRDYPCHWCIVKATPEQMEAWEPDPARRKFLILEPPGLIEKERREPVDKEIRAYTRAVNTRIAIDLMLERRARQAAEAADRAAAEAEPRTPRQEVFMEIDRAGSSSQG